MHVLLNGMPPYEYVLSKCAHGHCANLRGYCGVAAPPPMRSAA